MTYDMENGPESNIKLSGPFSRRKSERYIKYTRMIGSVNRESGVFVIYYNSIKYFRLSQNYTYIPLCFNLR